MLKRATRKLCAFDGCTRFSRVGGMCAMHGTRKECSTPGCTFTARLNSRCARCAKQTCAIAGCTKMARRQGLCLRCGGGFECVGPTCSRTVPKRGTRCYFCVPEKRCLVPGCGFKLLPTGKCRKLHLDGGQKHVLTSLPAPKPPPDRQEMKLDPAPAKMLLTIGLPDDDAFDNGCGTTDEGEPEFLPK